MNPVVARFQLLRAGAQKLGPERRVILLHGPVGSAKSTIVRPSTISTKAVDQAQQIISGLTVS